MAVDCHLSGGPLDGQRRSFLWLHPGVPTVLRFAREADGPWFFAGAEPGLMPSSFPWPGQAVYRLERREESEAGDGPLLAFYRAP